jgi:propionate CoA-transferase
LGAGAYANKAVADLQKLFVEACVKASKRVNSVVNHDGCRIADDLYDEYARMIEHH